jgi:tRNA uridine 5-carboxymethylaminomethyl modification enzyme
MNFDVIVIGGGHAGIEAAHICAKMRIRVLLITSHLDLIGQMSCNPAIGGIAKGNIVREIDALGGLMGRLIDRAGIHFKMLNQTKGMAVWGNRAQADKQKYRFYARKFLEEQKSLHILQGFVKRIKTNGDGVSGIVMDSGEEINSKSVILTTGTFLNGIAHIGLESFPCGRLGEPPSLNLTESIKEFGIEAGRLKTGTSPRIDGRTVYFEKLAEQSGDAVPWPFSFSTEGQLENKAVCWIAKTSKETHKIILSNLNRSPLYTGKIKSTGPRYCPSIEDKVVRFGERDGHTLFLEPEGLSTSEMYLNGLSTSLPFDVQQQMVNSIIGFESAEILRPGYGIEYDYFPPVQLWPTLESKTVRQLYFAGQINGTSGYEEAACQGLVAGVNSARKLLGNEEMVLGRDTSYTGVLIDDLVTKGTEEPYRMFTSRAEHRLMLRQDNADERLMPLAFKMGLIERSDFENRQRIWDEKRNYKAKLFQAKIDPSQWISNEEETRIRIRTSAAELLKRPNVAIEDVCTAIGENISNREIGKGLEADIKYAGFIEKDRDHLEKFRKMENEMIPEKIRYETIPGLLNESKGKLSRIKPRSLGQALRIPGVTPADITVLMVYISKQKNVSRETQVRV